MTLNGVMALILLFSPNSIALQTDYEVVEILSPISSLPLLAETNAQRGLSTIAEHLFYIDFH